MTGGPSLKTAGLALLPSCSRAVAEPRHDSPDIDGVVHREDLSTLDARIRLDEFSHRPEPHAESRPAGFQTGKNFSVRSCARIE